MRTRRQLVIETAFKFTTMQAAINYVMEELSVSEVRAIEILSEA